MQAYTIKRAGLVVVAWTIGLLATGAEASAQCSVELTSGLRAPLGIELSNKGHLLVAETGTTGALHSGRISIVGRDGARRTLLDGLPSATNDVNDASGPAGLVMRGRTLYVLIGIGDAILAVAPGSPVRVANPNPSSRIFSSILAVHFSAYVEKTTTGFVLTTADHEALANGEEVRFPNGGEDDVVIELVANFPDYIPNPTPAAPANVTGSNPFDLDLIGDDLYVTDGGRNLVWKTRIDTGAFAPLAAFAPIPNPTGVGGPFVEAVPTGIRAYGGQLLVTLFRGFPFPPGTSSVELVDPGTGAHAPILGGLRTAIDVLVTSGGAGVLVLEHGSGPLLPPFTGPGLLTAWGGGGSTVLANCLGRPTSMVGDERKGLVYITELINGRVVVVR